MAKARGARGGRKGKKKAAKSARRPKASKKVKKAARKAVRKPAKKKPAKKKAAKKKPAARSSKRPARKAGRKAAPRPAAGRSARTPARTPARPASRTPARGAAASAAPKKLPNLDRARRRLAEAEPDLVPSAPSTLGYEGGASAARSGRSEMRDAIVQHTQTGPALTGGDVDADWEDAYAVGDEAPGGDNPTPDQDRVDDIGKALGVQYDDNEELKGAEKIIERDRHRWELDPASSDDYVDRKREED